MPEVSYEYVPNTIVDALNEVHQKLNDSEVKFATTVTDALNNISVDLGGTRHLRAPEAIKDIGEHLGEGGGSETSGYTLVPVTFVDETTYGFSITIPLVTIEDSEEEQLVFSKGWYDSESDNYGSWFLLVPDGEYAIKVGSGGFTFIVNGATYNSINGTLTDISSEGVTITVEQGDLQ